MAMLKLQSHEPGKRLVLGSSFTSQKLISPLTLFIVLILLFYACVGLILFIGTPDERTTRAFLFSLLFPVLPGFYLVITSRITIDRESQEIKSDTSLLRWTLRSTAILFNDLDKITVESYAMSTTSGHAARFSVFIASWLIDVALKPKAWVVKAVRKNGKELILNWGGTDQFEMLDLAQKIVAITGARLEINANP